MYFNKFTIRNYKCFQNEQSMKFAVPKNDVNGSGITYLVGSNNSGKTTVIEGMSIKDQKDIRGSERVSSGDPEFQLFENDTVVRRCILERTENSTITEKPKLSDDNTFEIISSRRHWVSSANSNYGQLGQSFGTTHNLDNRQNNLDVGSELKTFGTDAVKYQEFISLVKRVIPEFTKFAIAFEEGRYIEYISNTGTRHKTEHLGDGVITVIRILLQLYAEKNNPIIIDEPELSLHPSAQRKLLKVLAEYSRTRQIVISTHSPYMINWDYLKGGAVVNRVVKKDDKYSEIFSLKSFDKYEGLINSANWRTPFTMDEVAKEIFFMEDGILFLEGQEDVGLLKQETLLENVNIFAYGVRGKNNFKFALTLAKDLGYNKISCILDFGIDETKIATELKSEFPEYKIVQWNREDIRDKESKVSKVKAGYFDINGNKKADTGDYEEKITEVVNFLST